MSIIIDPEMKEAVEHLKRKYNKGEVISILMKERGMEEREARGIVDIAADVAESM